MENTKKARTELRMKGNMQYWRLVNSLGYKN